MSELVDSFKRVDSACGIVAKSVQQDKIQPVVEADPSDNTLLEMPTVVAAEYGRGMTMHWQEITVEDKKALFEAIEINVNSKNQAVVGVWATGFLEALCAELDKQKLAINEVLQYVGEESLEYMNAWNEFNGVKPYGP